MISARIYWSLLLVSLGVLALRVAAAGIQSLRLGQETEYQLEQWIEISASAGDFDLEMFVPASNSRLEIVSETFSAGSLRLRLDESPEGRRLLAEGDRQDLPGKIRYEATLRSSAVEFDLAEDLRWGAVETVAADSTRWIPAGHAEIRELLGQIAGMPAGTEPPRTPAAWRSALASAGIGPVELARRAHRYCQDDILAAGFSGTTDALTALRLGESSCGGKSRAMVALLRTAGVPTRLVGGVLMGNTRSKRTSHIWVELRFGEQWVPYDPLNDHVEELPAHYLRLYDGDLPLIRHTPGLAFDYGFRSPTEAIPSAWAQAEGKNREVSRLPLMRREHFSLLLLAPFALLFTVFCRQVIGLDSIGVFLPVLLGLCVTQVGWAVSVALLAATLVFGVLLRLALSRLRLLRVARAGVMITAMVMIMLVFAIFLERFGIRSGRAALILPLAALAMAVERFTVEALDNGTRSALALLGQTMFLAAGSALILGQPLFKLLAVTYPEILLVVVAEMIMLGQYRGLRLRELWRFRALRRAAS
jgi:hypothetical protein